jgi:COP9 signalosome complex subunit 3
LLYQCVTSPAQQVSAIQIDAYKKLILLQLLKEGKTRPLPRYTSQAVLRATRSKIASIETYQNIAKAYEAELTIKLNSKDSEQIQRQANELQENVDREFEKAAEVLIRDLNVGLMRQLLAVYTRRKIQRLSRLFNRIKVGDIVNLLGGRVEGAVGAEASQVVMNALQQMHADRWIRLTLEGNQEGTSSSPQEVIVHFSEFKVDHAGLEAAKQLTSVMQEGKYWDQIVEQRQKSVRSSEAYLTKVSARCREQGG